MRRDLHLRRFCILLACTCLPLAATTVPAQDAKPQMSAHRPGPGGLEGWTLSYDIGEPNQGFLPMTLVLARHGQIIQRIKGDPFLWAWVFTDGGKRVAVESGPLHFSMACLLLDLASGREIAHYDCYREPLAANAPSWVRALQKQNHTANP